MDLRGAAQPQGEVRWDPFRPEVCKLSEAKLAKVPKIPQALIVVAAVVHNKRLQSIKHQFPLCELHLQALPALPLMVFICWVDRVACLQGFVGALVAPRHSSHWTKGTEGPLLSSVS